MSFAAPVTKASNWRFDEYDGAINVVPNNLVTANIDALDVGTVIAGSNSSAKAVRLQMPSDFDDSIYSDIRVWMANQAPLAGHAWLMEAALLATNPTLDLTDPLDDTPLAIPKNALSSIRLTAKGAASVGPDSYVPADKSIQGMIIQLQLAALATPYSQIGGKYAPPILFLESARSDYGAESTISEDLVHMARELCSGHDFVFSRVDCFVELTDVPSQVGVWHYMESLNDSSVTHEATDSDVEWKKFKPEVTVQRARGGAEASVSFALGAASNPILKGLCQSKDPVRNTTTRMIENSYQAATSTVRYCKLIFRHYTLGMGMIEVSYPRVRLTEESFSPGAGEFAEASYTGMAQVGCDSARTLQLYATSDTPVEIATLPIMYKSVAV